MILVPALLGLMEVFVFWQLDVFGAGLVAFIVFLFAVRNDARMAEIVIAAAVYSFIVSIFVDPWTGFIEMLSVSIASLITVVTYRILLESRFKKVVGRLRYLHFSIVFNAVYFLLLGLRFIGDYSTIQALGFFGLTVSFSFVLLLIADLIPLKRREEVLL